MNNKTGFQLEELQDFLCDRNIDISQYGKGSAKDISDLLEEINKGESHLDYHRNVDRMIREVRLVAINVFYKGDFLFEEKQVFKDENGDEIDRMRIRDDLEESLGEKMTPGADIKTEIKRAMKEELGIILDDSQVGPYVMEKRESESRSYPQIYSYYTKFVTDVELNDDQYNPEGYIEQQKKKNTYFKWDMRM